MVYLRLKNIPSFQELIGKWLRLVNYNHRLYPNCPIYKIFKTLHLPSSNNHFMRLLNQSWMNILMVSRTMWECDYCLYILMFMLIPDLLEVLILQFFFTGPVIIVEEQFSLLLKLLFVVVILNFQPFDEQNV